jgi:hypothetical protein
MVKRSFGQPSGESRVNGESSTDANGRATGSESERINGEPDADRTVVGDGENTERDTERDGGSIGVVEIDPSNLSEYIARGSTGSGSGDSTRQRRKRGPNKRTTGAKKAADSVKPFVTLAHQWAAALLKTPELLLTEEETEKFNSAYVNFCQYHEIPILSDKRMSEINLIATLCLIYGPRYVAIRNRHKQERAAKRATNVTPITAVN